MQDIKVNSLGYKELVYSVPSSVEEFDRLAKAVGACLNEGIRNVLYRSSLASFRDGFLHGIAADGDKPEIKGLDALTGIERKSKVTKPEVKDADGKITQEEVTAWDEKEEEYANRVFATLASNGTFPSIDAARAAYAPHAQAVLTAIVFDPAKTERASAGPKKTPKTYLSIAEEIVKMAGDLATGIAKFEAKTGRKVAEATVEALARAVWEDQSAQRKQIASGYAG